jgi:PTS system cellobiose-specific IIC component
MAATSAKSESMGKLEKTLLPIAQKVGKNKYLLTLRDSFAMIMPLLIIGSMFTLVASFPIPAWTSFLTATKIGDYTLSSLLAVPANCTVGLMAVFVAYNIGYNMAGYDGLEDKNSAGIASLASWFILMPLITKYTPTGTTDVYDVSSIPLSWVGARGVFVAIVMGIITTKIYGWFVKRDITIKMPEGVPPTVARAFSALIPMAVTFFCVWVLRVIFVFTPWEDFFTFIYSILQAPFQSLSGTVWAQAIVYLFAHLLWFLGIHGTNITGSIYDPILIALSAENQAAVAAGQAPVNIINYQFETLFATMGGAGSALSLVIGAMMECKSERIRKLCKLSFAPCIFEINEPIIFGLPIVMNPVLFIPFLGVPLVNIILTYLVMAAGLVPISNGVMLPWTTPPILSGFLSCGWQGAVWQVILLIIGTAIYIPFLKTLDKEYLDEEHEAAEAETKSELDDIDLDSIDIDSL